MAASFNAPLLERVAGAISDEARAKHHEFERRGDRGIYKGLTFWSPTINIFRDPRWGRGQETFGEDPYLTSRLGVAYVRGLQGDDPRYLKLLKLNKTKVSVARSVGLLRESVASLMQESTVEPNSMPREYADRALEMLKERDRRRALQAMIEQAVPYDLKRRRTNWSRIEELVAEYQNVDVPTLILWGARDEALPVSMGYKLQRQLPDVVLRVILESKHSLQLERPYECLGFIEEFLFVPMEPEVEYFEPFAVPAVPDLADQD